jgi:uncharacterized damage-inducible protein DinB
MTPMLQPMLSEVQQEAATTRRVLDRLPEDKLSWRPHQKSMTLGQLAKHVATIPGAIAKMAEADEFEVKPGAFTFPDPANIGEIFAAHDESIRTAENYLQGLSEKSAMSMWKLKSGGRELMNIPRVAMLRTVMMNHLYHHRGQLSVYLRLLDIPVPTIYGPSADDNPFV